MICKIITGRLEVWDKTPLCCFAVSLLVILSCNQVTQRKTTLGSKLPLSEMVSFAKLVPRSSNQKYFNNVGTSLNRKVFQSVFFQSSFLKSTKSSMGLDRQKAWNVAKPTFSLYKVVHKNTSIKHLNYQDSSFTSRKDIDRVGCYDTVSAHIL